MKQFRTAFLLAALMQTTAFAGTLRIAAYNLENYLDQPTTTRPHAKSAAAKAKIREGIKAMNPDVLALEEMGGTNALLELRASLQAEGQDFTFWEHIPAFDTNIHVAVLSKLPIIARHPHTNDFFLLDGRRFQVKRGFAEVEIQAANHFTFTLIAAHLKSQLTTPEADEAEERLGEAKILRGIIDARLANDPKARIVVLGDFNDTKDSAPTREIIGRGKFKLTDTRPAERIGEHPPVPPPAFDPHDIAWTYYFGTSDTYSRIDYILLSPALKRNWLAEETYIPKIPDWQTGSDHRPIVAGFKTE